MQRDERAYLNDIVEACSAIESAVSASTMPGTAPTG
jgi:uncharacterized protein with HEPN domain